MSKVIEYMDIHRYTLLLHNLLVMPKNDSLILDKAFVIGECYKNALSKKEK